MNADAHFSHLLGEYDVFQFDLHHLAAQPDVLLLCYQVAASAGRPAFERCIDHAMAELQTLETQRLRLAERDALAHSWRYLVVDKTAWGERYSSDLTAEFTKRVSTKLARALGANFRVMPSGFDSFGSVDDADLKQKINAQRLL